MTSAGMAASIKAAIISSGQTVYNDDSIDAIAAGIVDYFHSNAELSGAVTTPDTTTGTITTSGSAVL